MISMFKSKELGYKETMILIVIAYAFSVFIRMLWLFWASDFPNFIWNDQVMINTNDGYFFGAAAQYLLDSSHADNPRIMIAINSYPGMVYLTYFLAKYTPFSLDTVMLYMPTVISSLVVVPIILTGRLIKLPWVGFFAALIGSIAWSYYNRTMMGYYDTDMFSVFLQFTILYLFLFTIYKKSDKSVLWLAFALLAYPLFYPQGLSLVYAMFILWVAYQLIFQRSEINTYLFIIVASVALWAFPEWIKIIIILAIFFYLEQIKSQLDLKKFFYLTITALVIFFLLGDIFTFVWHKVVGYISRGVEERGLHYFQVIQTVREAGKISWETVANRIIGHPLLFALSLVGYILLVLKEKPFIIALPLIGVGVFAHWAGLRFTVYAVPVAAFSLVYFFYRISFFLENKKIAWGAFLFLSLFALYPNISHVLGYKVPTVFNKEEVKVLTALNTQSDSKDYTVAWWDYGYPIWYYADTSTLIDGAKHHNDNFIVSKILTTDSQTLAANLSRLAVETYVDSNYSTISTKIFQGGKIDPNDLLDQMESDDFKLPAKTRDIYLFLPQRMLNIFPTVGMFSNIDLTTGEMKRQPFFYVTGRFANKGKFLNLGNGIVLDKEQGTLSLGAQKTKLKRFTVVGYDMKGKLVKNVQNIDENAPLSVIYMRSYNTFLVLDEKMYNSLYIKLFVLEEYDHDLFEPVVMSPYAKVYKLKK